MSPFYYLVQQLINAVSIGSLYALMALGLAMVFGILRLINFAHGDLIMVGSFTALLLMDAKLPFWAAALAAIAVSIFFGLLMERVAYRPIRGAPDVAMLLTSFAVTIFLENLAIIIFTPKSRPFPTPEALGTAITLGPLRISSLDVAAIAVAFVLLVGLTIFISRTETGISMRAASQDLLAARLMGIDVNKVIMSAFAIGSLLAGVVGLLWSARVGKIDPLMGFGPVLKAFVATVIGGLGSLVGLVISSIVITILPDLLRSFSAFQEFLYGGFIILVILFAPEGIYGFLKKYSPGKWREKMYGDI